MKTLKENFPDGYIQDGSVDYIYLFQANFKKGKNVIKHSYEVEMSSYIDSYYQFDYVLTAAKRWAGGKIKDFQLIIDMGEFQDFTIVNTFFTSLDQWNMVGCGISKLSKNLEGTECSEFVVRSGILEFHQLNFDPKGEIFIDSPKRIYTGEETNRLLHLPFSPEEFQYLQDPESDLEKKIYKNLPFAIRGYIFKNPELQKLYESQSWYFPDPNFHGVIDVLPEEEQTWVKRYSE
jgi:YARHG domain